ncbi:peptidase [Jeotgalicoccus nanhaiensis]|uniref:Peptidase n=1 Tax=Jeotgalicoccus nanhaiensis TaxID=568603 RepID=A0ABR9XVZ9_9STAP|nr:S41 family peptidase [Jeotgalicoccus nanhaiensis]MBF0753057.1 peptidase [Jeotgalicoccus nanhaiensis]TFU63207.1 peptidase [Jeotgalicoccus nanhaiensis]
MYIDIFNEVVDIMENDYAGHQDKKGWDSPDTYRESILQLNQQGHLDDYTFIKIVNDYLLDFKDPHMFFISKDESSSTNRDIGFKVRRFKDALYVTETTKETNIDTGDKIIALDGLSVNELEQKHIKELMKEAPERQRWERVIEKYNKALIEKNNNENTVLNLSLYEKEIYNPLHHAERLNSHTLLMTLTDFFSSESIEKVLKDHDLVMKNLKNLIIDVRKNRGGSDASFHQLLQHLFPAGKTSVSLDNYKMNFNITERTANLQINGLRSLYQETSNESYKQSLKDMINFFESNTGKGFVSLDNGGDFEVEGSEFPKNIVVLSDVYCGSAGDIFVDLAGRSQKVTVIGRATAGLNDYSNLINKDWNDVFSLYYPTSRMEYLDKGEKDTGIEPDIYVEWSPEHLFSDIDLKTALNFLGTK